MRKLALAAAVSVSLASVSSVNFALEMGEIEIFSALNQNLDAEIDLLDISAAEFASVSATLASESAFARAGLAVTPVLRSLRFDVEQRPDGAAIIKVSSDMPVVEPFLNFLVEVDSSESSATTREYTLLLDPPAFIAQPSTANDSVTGEVSSNDAVSVGGAEIDLVDVEPSGEEAEPTVIFTELGTLPTDVEDIDVAVVEEQVDIEIITSGGGEAINLGAELLDRTELAEVDEAADEAATIDLLSAENAIFIPELESLQDTDDNVVDIDTLATEDRIDALASDANLVSDSARREGVSIDLDPVESDPQILEVADEGTDDVIPQVTLETIETLPISESAAPESSVSIESSVSVESTVAVVEPAIEPTAIEPTAIEPTAIEPTQEIGLDVDLSDIDDSDAFQPIPDAVADVDIASEPAGGLLPIENDTTTDSLPLAEVADASEGQALDISGIVNEVAQSGTTQVVAPISGESASYTVRSQDTLWSIARRQKPAGVTTNQMMAAIVDANPQAFVNGDMNSMRAGAELSIPGGTGGSQSSDPVVADTEESAPVAETAEQPASPAATDAPVKESAATEEVAMTEPEAADTDSQTQSAAQSDISTDLDEVNKKMLLAQEELSSEAEQRDELNNRVVELEDNLSKMKELITLRESELNNLQNEMSDPVADGESMTSEAATEEAPDANALPDAQEEAAVDEMVQELENQIDENTVLAQERVDAQADADRNVVSAQAQAQSLRIANEEDALRQQLAQLRLEKEQLEQTAQADKLELVQQAEAEKAQLLENASAEREQILATLELEKQRIADEAAAERAKIAAEAESEKEALLAEVQAERDQLAAEGEEMRSKLEALEAKNSELTAQAQLDREQLAEASRQAEEEQAQLLAEAEAEKQKFEEESTRVKDKLAELQAEANANLSNNTGNAEIDRAVSDTDAVGEISDLAVPAVVGGAAAVAPLEREMGDRKKVLAIGGGVALLGLLGAWATRRKKPVATAQRGRGRMEREVDEESMDTPAPTQFDNQRSNHFEEVEGSRPSMGQAAVAASAAAAATGAAVVSRGEDEVEEVYEEQVPAAETPTTVSEVDSAPPPMVEEGMVDDTLTEADVYLRYGLHGQAEDLLKSAIDKAPDVPEYQVKLMESYHDQKSAPEFKAVADKFRDRFGESSEHWEHVAEMGRNLDSSDGAFSRVGAMGAAAAGAASVAAGVASATDSDDAPHESVADETASENLLDETIDAAEDFNISDLEATGDFSAITDSLPDDLDEISLDEIDMAALDDDGTLNLEEFTGDQMSGLDLGTLDLTNPEGDSTLDNLTLDDADLNSLGDVTSGVRDGLSSEIDLDEGTISRTDEMETMLDLAKAYIDMEDSESAESALKDIINNGSDAQKMEAQDLLGKLK